MLVLVLELELLLVVGAGGLDLITSPDLITWSVGSDVVTPRIEKTTPKSYVV